MKKKVKCWDFFQCNEKECPVFKLKELNCWLISGTHCRNEIQGKFLEKMEMCFECEPFRANVDISSMEETLKVAKQQFTEFRKMVEDRDTELEHTGMELALGLSEVFEALMEISAGDPDVRVSETSKLELVAKLKHMVNLTAENLAEIVNLSHEFAVGLAEHFDVLNQVSIGKLDSRVSGTSQVELLESLKKVTNQMIESVSIEITERKRTEGALRKARDELERRVEERTSELSKSNELLKRELTERKRAEEKLQKKNEELENFVSVVSHDLKTPIIGVQGFSNRLLKNYQEKLDERGRIYLEQIQANARRMETFVSDLLSLARLGQVVSTFEDVPCFQIVRKVTSGVRGRLKARGIELTVVDNLPTIHCDGERIRQVFENLLVNAIKFTGRTANPRIEIGYEDRGDAHQFHLRDNGIGIDRKHHQKIFEMFHRLKETEDEEGTGIGLAIVDRIVSNHGGKIWVESQKGKGATFYFTLPKAPSSVTHS